MCKREGRTKVDMKREPERQEKKHADMKRGSDKKRERAKANLLPRVRWGHMTERERDAATAAAAALR